MENVLLIRLERLRKQMNELAKRKGLCHPEVLLISQEIDQVHNRINELSYHHQTSNKNKFIIKESSKEKSIYLYATAACV
jgi:S-adenosylmethionine synthetase